MTTKKQTANGPVSVNVESDQRQQRSVTPVQRHDVGATPQYSGLADLTGKCPPLFDLCADDALMSFSMAGTYSELFDWLGFRSTDIWRKHRNFITYIGNEGTAAGAPISTLQGPLNCDDCGPGPKTEWGSCDFVCEGFDNFKISGPVRKDDCETLRYCEKQPTYRVDGSPITNNDEWDMVQMTSVLIADMHRWLIKGSYGLENQINFGYVSSNGDPCPAMDGNVVDFGGNPLCPTDGITGVTYNGNAVPDGQFTFIDVLRSLVNRISWRIRNTPQLRSTRPEMALVVPHDWVDCLLRCYVCWSVCGCSVERMDSFEARAMLERLEGSGQFGMGSIRIHNMEIPLMPYDWEMVDNTTGNADMYLLTRAAGNTPLIEPEFQNMNTLSSKQPGIYDVMDNGLLAFYDHWEHSCYQRHGKMNARMCVPAPWAQVRFTNVPCDLTLDGYVNIDPLSPFFLSAPVVKQQGTC